MLGRIGLRAEGLRQEIELSRIENAERGGAIDSDQQLQIRLNLANLKTAKPQDHWAPLAPVPGTAPLPLQLPPTAATSSCRLLKSTTAL